MSTASSPGFFFCFVPDVLPLALRRNVALASAQCAMPEGRMTACRSAALRHVICRAHARRLCACCLAVQEGRAAVSGVRQDPFAVPVSENCLSGERPPRRGALADLTSLVPRACGHAQGWGGLPLHGARAAGGRVRACSEAAGWRGQTAAGVQALLLSRTCSVAPLSERGRASGAQCMRSSSSCSSCGLE